MNNQNISHSLSVVFRFGVILVTLTTLFLFANLTTEFYETPKFLSLIAFIATLLILSTLKNLAEGKVVLNITPLDLPLLLLLGIAIISTILSSSPHLSLIGNLPRINGGLASIVAVILFYFLLVNNLKNKDVSHITIVLLGSGVILSLITLLSYFGLKILPFDFAQGLNFTPTGASFSTAALLVLLLPFPLYAILKSENRLDQLVQLALLVLFGITIFLTSSWSLYLAALFVVLASLIIHANSINKSLSLLLIPALIITVVVGLSYLPTFNQNPLYKSAQNFPREVQLDFPTSWKIAVSAFRDSPFWGTGPATTLFNFTQYKPVEFNNSRFWNIRFDQLFNEYLIILSTLGGLGLLIFIVVTVQVLKSALHSLKDPEVGPLALSAVTIFIILALHSSSLVFGIIAILILSSYFTTNSKLTKNVHLKLGAARSSDDSLSFDVFPLLLLLLILGLSGVATFITAKYALADYYHRQALNSVANNNGRAAYDNLVQAENLNPYNDLYRTDIAQTNFALANAIAAAKGPTEASPGGSLTDQDKQTIQQLLQQAINEGRAATNLSPRNPTNWEILGSIYRQISGVAQNSLQFALDAYGRAIQLDPLNPILRLNVGGIYYSLRNYDSAIRFFTDSVNLKPDYTNGLYNLSVALRDKGDLSSAQAVAERLISLVNPDSPDYKIASDYLSDLKARIATGSAQESAISAPAGQSTSPLQQNQPRILDLPQPQQIATPPAVKK